MIIYYTDCKLTDRYLTWTLAHGVPISASATSRIRCSPLNLHHHIDYLRKNYSSDYTPLQLRVRELTNNDSWGTSPKDMREVCDLLNTKATIEEVLAVLFDRIQSADSTWRNKYKSIVFIEYLLLHGSNETVNILLQEDHSARIVIILNELAAFEYVDSKGKDQGINVRTRASKILPLLQDSQTLKSSRDNTESSKKILAQRNVVEPQHKEIEETTSSNPSPCQISTQTESSFDPPEDPFDPLSSHKKFDAVPIAPLEAEALDEFTDFQGAPSSTTAVKSANVLIEFD